MKTSSKLKKLWDFEQNQDKGSISSLWSVVLLIICVSLYCLSVLKFKSLPNVVPDSTHDRFSGLRAKDYLRNLTSLGPRVGGSSANELGTVSLLVGWLTEIKSVAEANGRSLDVDVQLADGSLMIGYSASSLVAVYRGVKNVVARLRPGQDTPQNALLLNAHFDTVPTSEGGGDDGSMCAVMLEMLAQLAHSPNHLQHSVIFLFNGFEENALQGSHAFITQHPWRSSVRAVLNLEAAGNGGREMVFQAGPRHPWLMNHYKRTAPRPYASTMAEEMFQAELIPSDTDFRIFRDYGRIPGMDLAFTYNGYLYHTEYDTEENFPADSLQHAGENVLPLVESLASSEELKDTQKHEDGNVVFYDFFNVALIYYTEKTGIIINSILSALGIILIGVSCFFFIRHGEISVVTFAREFGFTMIIQMLSLALGAGLVMLAAVIYNAAGRPLAWFSSSYLLFFLYFCPFFLGLSIGPACFVGFRKNNPLTLSINAQLFLHIQHLYYILVLVALSGRNIRSSFLVMIPVFFYNASLLINILFKFQSKRRAWMYVHLLCQIIPFMWFATNSVAQFSTFIPMQGRSGAGNPEILMAVFCIMYGVFLGGYIVPLITMFRSPRITTLLFVLLWIVGIILMVTPLGFPFREAKSPQRVAFYHMNRQFHELSGGVRRADSGFFVSTGDSFGQSAIQDTLGTSLDLNDECAKEFLCGFPFSISSGSWYPAELATIPDTDVALTLTQREDLADGSVVLHFALQGPDRMSLLISPEPEGTLSEWSFEEPVPNRSNGTYSYRSALFITYTNFKLGVSQPSDTTEFWLKITNAPNMGKILDISVTAHYIWHQDAKSSEFQSKVDALPSWTTVQSWIVSYDAYEF